MRGTYTTGRGRRRRGTRPFELFRRAGCHGHASHWIRIGRLLCSHEASLQPLRCRMSETGFCGSSTIQSCRTSMCLLRRSNATHSRNAATPNLSFPHQGGRDLPSDVELGRGLQYRRPQANCRVARCCFTRGAVPAPTPEHAPGCYVGPKRVASRCHHSPNKVPSPLMGEGQVGGGCVLCKGSASSSFKAPPLYRIARIGLQCRVLAMDAVPVGASLPVHRHATEDSTGSQACPWNPSRR